MNAVEKLQAAIDKLESLRAESAPGVWRADPDDKWWLEDVHHRVVRAEGSVAAYSYDGDAELIVTLRRTIDAQLAILRGAIEEVRVAEGHGIPAEHVGVAAIALADAILGGA